MARRFCGRGEHDLTVAGSTITLWGTRHCRQCYEAKHPPKPAAPVFCAHGRVLSDCRICYLDQCRAARKAAPALLPVEDL